MNEPRVVCVLGPPRSGTSLATRILELAGVYLGREEHMHAAPRYNPRGNFEHAGIHALNERILTKTAGRHWRTELPRLPRGWPRARALAPLRERARSILDEEFAGIACWGFKDPKTSLTWPFWQELLPPLHRVLCVRSPAAVARSAARAFGRTFEHGLYTWLRFTESALERSVPGKRSVVFYDDWFEPGAPQLDRIAAELGLADAAGDPRVRRAVADFVDAGLRHDNAYGAAEMPAVPPELLAPVEELHRELRGPAPFGRTLAARLGALADALAPRVRELETRRRRALAGHWERRLRQAVRDLEKHVAAGETLVLIDESRLNRDALQAWHILPFPERDGLYTGPPPDDATAIRELERLRAAGARFAVLAWPAFWWLDHYAGLQRHLRHAFPTVLATDHVLVFDLRNPERP